PRRPNGQIHHRSGSQCQRRNVTGRLTRNAQANAEGMAVVHILSEEQVELQRMVKKLCSDFPEDYWIKVDKAKEYPQEFVDALGAAGLLSVLIPEEYGGGGGTLHDAAIILETINRSGGTGIPAHAQMYTMKTILRHGSPEQKERWLPPIARGELRLQSMGVTEADAGSDTSRIKTTAVREGKWYRINGSKMWTSRVQHSDLMLLLARTTPRDQVRRRFDGLSTFLID